MPSNLIVFDTSTGLYYCPPLETGPAFAPVVSGNLVAYEGKNSQIYVIDMMSGVQRQVSLAGSKNANPGSAKENPSGT